MYLQEAKYSQFVIVKVNYLSLNCKCLCCCLLDYTFERRLWPWIKIVFKFEAWILFSRGAAKVVRQSSQSPVSCKEHWLVCLHLVLTCSRTISCLFPPTLSPVLDLYDITSPPPRLPGDQTLPVDQSHRSERPTQGRWEPGVFVMSRVGSEGQMTRCHFHVRLFFFSFYFLFSPLGELL